VCPQDGGVAEKHRSLIGTEETNVQARRILFQSIKILVSLALIVFLLYKISPSKLAAHLRGVNPFVLSAGVGVFFLSSFLGSIQWHLLLRAGSIEIPFSKSFRLYFVGLFFNNFLPANVGGDAVKIYDVARIGNDPYQVFAITLLDRIIGITGLCILAVAASCIALGRGGGYRIISYLIIFIACIAPVFALVLNRRLSGGVRNLFGRIQFRGLGERFHYVFGQLGSFARLRALLGRLTLLAVVVQSMRVATHILVGTALGVDLAPMALVYFYVFVPLLGLVMILPISVNGLGVREGTGVLLFAQIGISSEQALLMEFITYVVMVLVSLIGGVFFLVRHVRSE
jgi:uncharacterized protein (TIRG00374 family)